MKTFFRFIFFALVALCFASFLVSPKKSDHKEAIVERIREVAPEDNEWVQFGSAIGGAFYELSLDSRLTIEDYGVVNFGVIDEDEKVSIGLLGRVFVLKKAELLEALK